MSSDPFGLIWLLVVLGGAVVLAAGYAYGTYQWRKRTLAQEHLSEAATKRNYEAEEARRREAEEKPRTRSDAAE